MSDYTAQLKGTAQAEYIRAHFPELKEAEKKLDQLIEMVEERIQKADEKAGTI